MDDGSICLQQISIPDISDLEEYLGSANISEWDVVTIVVSNNYIPNGHPGQMALRNATQARQGVFPAAAIPQQNQPAQQQQTQPTVQGFATRVGFFRSVATDPIGTASAILGFDVADMLRPVGSPPIEWTNSLADLYDGEFGFFDIESTFTEPFVVGDISEPFGFDALFADSIRDGNIIPASK